MKKLLGFFAFVFFSFYANSQMPTVGGFAASPDEWLLGSGQNWHFRTATSKSPQTLTYREPNSEELVVVERAKSLFDRSSAKAMALINKNQVIWTGYKSPANQNSIFLSFSVGKTVTAMAIGKAICKGKLQLSDQAYSFVPELKGTNLGNATVEQLLKMSSGTSTINHDSSVISAQQDRDMRAGKISFLDILSTSKISQAEVDLFGVKRLPGERFDYHSTDPLLLGVILNRATGTTFVKWVEQEVLLPAGISHFAVIGQDHFGFGQSDGNIRMTLDDWARFAIWVKSNELGHDCFANYVKQASKTQIANLNKREGASFDGYGYLIWTDNNRQKDSYWAVGYGGQRLAWNHKNERVLIVFSNVENYMNDIYQLYRDWSSLPD